MFEIEYGDKVYGFKFGLGFVREINKKMTKPMEGVPGKQQEIGLNYYIGCMYDEDPVALVEMLEIANKTEKERITRAVLDAYIEDENTDIEKLFADVRNFLKSANATKKMALAMQEMYDKEKAKQAAAAV